MKLLMDYDWPGNVRELENVVERAVVLSSQELMDADLLPESVRTKEIYRRYRMQPFRISFPRFRANRVACRGRQLETLTISNHGRSRAPHH